MGDISPPPFTVRILDNMVAFDDGTSSFSQLLPATRRTTEDHIAVPYPDSEFLHKELSVKRLNDVQDWLWLCGRPMPPRPLHHQRLLSREVVITESAELHMVWWRNRIYLKPLPPYLLDPEFWRAYIIDAAGLHDAKNKYQGLDASARGFLFSYSALIAYESDFRIAKECGLLPEAVTWAKWKLFTAQILDGHRYDGINPRYWYGELRLSRLNKVYALRKGAILRGYSSVASYSFYGDLIRDNFAVLTGILGYVVIALSAMQVGLGVEGLQSNTAFQNTSYGFTVFSLTAPLAGAGAIITLVLPMIVSNWMATKAYEKKRFREMKVGPTFKRSEAA